MASFLRLFRTILASLHFHRLILGAVPASWTHTAYKNSRPTPMPKPLAVRSPLRPMRGIVKLTSILIGSRLASTLTPPLNRSRTGT